MMLIQAPKAWMITAILMTALNENLLYSTTDIIAPTIYKAGYILLIMIQLVSLISYMFLNSLFYIAVRCPLHCT